jgi:hypothetical protein
MSVLNQANDGQFNVLITLVRAAVRFGPRERSELLAFCGADAPGVDPSRLKGTLLRWTELGLFELHDDRAALREPHRSRLGKDVGKAEARLPAVAREIVLAVENNQRFWEADSNKSADLTRGLSWMLAQDVYTLDTSSHGRIQELETAQISDLSRRMMQNDTRWTGLKAWMIYLGFGRGEAAFAVDPTVAMRDSLYAIFPDAKPLTAREFLSRAAELLPVLDQGAYRLMVEESLRNSAWSPLDDNRVSSSLSRAIERLVHAGELAIEQRADAEDGLKLTGVNGRVWRSFTHIWRPARQAGAR